jgi:hypothetical protein
MIPTTDSGTAIAPFKADKPKSLACPKTPLPSLWVLPPNFSQGFDICVLSSCGVVG